MYDQAWTMSTRWAQSSVIIRVESYIYIASKETTEATIIIDTSVLSAEANYLILEDFLDPGFKFSYTRIWTHLRRNRFAAQRLLQ